MRETTYDGKNRPDDFVIISGDRHFYFDGWVDNTKYYSDLKSLIVNIYTLDYKITRGKSIIREHKLNQILNN